MDDAKMVAGKRKGRRIHAFARDRFYHLAPMSPSQVASLMRMVKEEELPTVLVCDDKTTEYLEATFSIRDGLVLNHVSEDGCVWSAELGVEDIGVAAEVIHRYSMDDFSYRGPLEWFRTKRPKRRAKGRRKVEKWATKIFQAGLDDLLQLPSYHVFWQFRRQARRAVAHGIAVGHQATQQGPDTLSDNDMEMYFFTILLLKYRE